jgi:hypothetical protein
MYFTGEFHSKHLLSVKMGSCQVEDKLDGEMERKELLPIIVAHVSYYSLCGKYYGVSTKN